MGEDDFDFSDSDLDDLPAKTLHNLEASAIRATQHQAPPAPESDYGLDDGDEVVNLDDDDAGPPHAFTANAAPQCAHAQQQAYDYTHTHNGDSTLDPDQMEVEQEPPRRSQADPSMLLTRIKKVGRRHVIAHTIQERR
jgi:hypothetical protein